MHGLILAGGEGSRLAADGIAEAKPLVRVGGRPQVIRLAEILTVCGAESVTVLVRRPVAGAVQQALAGAGHDGVRVVACETPSSLHTLTEGLFLVPPGEVVCTMVDTVMPDEGWRRVVGDFERQLGLGRDVVLAVTPHVDDDTPLWVRRNGDGGVTAVGAEPVSPPCVTGGVYGFSRLGRLLAEVGLRRGLSRMRGLLGWLAASGASIGSVEVDRIVDLDRRADLDAAERWLREPAWNGGNA